MRQQPQPPTPNDSLLSLAAHLQKQAWVESLQAYPNAAIPVGEVAVYTLVHALVLVHHAVCTVLAHHTVCTVLAHHAVLTVLAHHTVLTVLTHTPHCIHR
jgi:hypothetical protein